MSRRMRLTYPRNGDDLMNFTYRRIALYSDEHEVQSTVKALTWALPFAIINERTLLTVGGRFTGERIDQLIDISKNLPDLHITITLFNPDKDYLLCYIIHNGSMYQHYPNIPERYLRNQGLDFVFSEGLY